MKKIIIMGASSGIGLRLAEEFASRGVRVGLAARHTHELEHLQEHYPDCVEYARIDITHRNAPSLLEELIAKTGGMDIYIHVAGIGYENPDLDPEREVDIIRTNACGFARMLSSAYGYYRRTGRKGHIVAVTSVAGTAPLGMLPAYSSSKKFARTYVRALEQLARIQKVDVAFTDIRPGWIRTPLLKKEREYVMEMSLDYAVPLIIKAMARKRRVAVIDWRWALLATAWQSACGMISLPGLPQVSPMDYVPAELMRSVSGSSRTQEEKSPEA